MTKAQKQLNEGGLAFSTDGARGIKSPLAKKNKAQSKPDTLYKN